MIGFLDLYCIRKSWNYDKIEILIVTIIPNEKFDSNKISVLHDATEI